MSLLGNLLWIVVGGGLIICVQYLLVGLGLCLTVVGIPWGVQAFKLAVLGLLPFGKEAAPTGDLAQGGLGLVLNIIWLIVGGLGIVLTHLLFAGLCAITVIGIPFAVQHWKLTKLALTPFGRDIRDIR
ncbi:MAG: YccF domain-containing protein [Planctomycetes bacterium]|nr:YccF domain-containing protein [Planctomycetota bacterium]